MSKPLLLQAVPTARVLVQHLQRQPKTHARRADILSSDPLPVLLSLLCTQFPSAQAWSTPLPSAGLVGCNIEPGQLEQSFRGAPPRRCHSRDKMMTVTLRSAPPFSNCSAPRDAGAWCGIWRIVNAHNKLAPSEPRVYCAAGMSTSVRHVQPSIPSAAFSANCSSVASSWKVIP